MTNDDVIRFLIGAMSLLFVIWQIARAWGVLKISSRPLPDSVGLIVGATSGFTSFVSHAGGPPSTMYMLSLKLSKTEYQANTVFVFWIINVLKAVAYGVLGIFTLDLLLVNLALAPFALLGAWLGVKAHNLVPEKPFYATTYCFASFNGNQVDFRRTHLSVVAFGWQNFCERFVILASGDQTRGSIGKRYSDCPRAGFSDEENVSTTELLAPRPTDWRALSIFTGASRSTTTTSRGAQLRLALCKGCRCPRAQEFQTRARQIIICLFIASSFSKVALRSRVQRMLRGGAPINRFSWPTSAGTKNSVFIRVQASASARPNQGCKVRGV